MKRTITVTTYQPNSMQDKTRVLLKTNGCMADRKELDKILKPLAHDETICAEFEDGFIFPRNCFDLFANWKGQLVFNEVDTSNVTNMAAMFYRCENANPDVSSFDTSQVTTMAYMFAQTKKANPDVSQFDTSKVGNMSYMFAKAESATPNVSCWNVGKVSIMHSMFEGALVANPDVSLWDVSHVKDFGYMFKDAPCANPDVSKWDVRRTESIRFMFCNAIQANPDVSNWRLNKIVGNAQVHGMLHNSKHECENPFHYNPYFGLDPSILF